MRHPKCKGRNRFYEKFFVERAVFKPEQPQKKPSTIQSRAGKRALRRGRSQLRPYMTIEKISPLLASRGEIFSMR